jgi:hypothetical protein
MKRRGRLSSKKEISKVLFQRTSNLPIVGIVPPPPLPFENKLAQMSKRVDAQDGVGNKPPNDFATQLCGKEKVITINIIKENYSISKQF